MQVPSSQWQPASPLAVLDRSARRAERDQRRLDWLAQTAAELARAESLLQNWYADAHELRAQVSRARCELRELQARIERNFTPVRT